MLVIVLILIIILILWELWSLALWCRHGHPLWKILGLFRYAHRGFRNEPGIPENSMKAFRRAIANNYGAELDVHLMRDGNLAVIHDSCLKRTAGADVMVEDLTKEELARYRLEGTDEQVPLFEDVLSLFQGKTPLIIELKSARGNYKELTAAACAMLDQYQVTYCMESFDPRCLWWLRKHRPNVVRGQLSQQFSHHPGDGAGYSGFLLFFLSNLLLNFLTRPDFIAYRFSDRHCLSLRWCRKFYKVQEVNWTITNKEEMEEAERDGNLVIFEQFDPRG